MPLKTILENLDDVPDAIKEHYVEKDGKFTLDLDGVDDHPTVQALKNAHERTKQERKKAIDARNTLQARLEKVPEEFDPDEWTRLKTLAEELEKDPDRKGKGGEELVAAKKMLEQKISNLEKAHNDALAKKNDELANKTAFITRLIVDEGLTKALIAAGIQAEYIKASKALLREDVTVEEHEGDYKAVVKSDVGDIDLAKYVADWAASDEGKIFVAPAKGGSARGSGDNKSLNNGAPNPWDDKTYNLTKQGEIVRTDRARAERLAKAAGKELPPA